MYNYQPPVEMAMKAGNVYLEPPVNAPDPMFIDGWPASAQVIPYGTGPWDVAQARIGGYSYQQLDRDLHHYTIGKQQILDLGEVFDTVAEERKHKYYWANSQQSSDRTGVPDAAQANDAEGGNGHDDGAADDAGQADVVLASATG
mmetsp:Transcript_29298/g.75524  ORF Transcript_29298/g.75524 Transcript_29298/m.75524 type:complete len:145 (+) Transcript_29298:209-643(+)